jgi:NADPH2:quinone reductase
MHAIVCHEFGSIDLLRYEEMPAPVPGPAEVLVEVHAIGLNFTDLLLVEGRSQLKRKFPIVPGVEAAGIVRAVGTKVTAVRVGQRVLGTCISGSYAEQVVFDQHEVFPIPDAMDMRVAATFYVASNTAHYALHDRAKLQTGETLLVLGAGGGAGISAVQVGKALGARVVAGASSEDKLALARAAGADAVVHYPAGPLELAAQKALAEALFAQARDVKASAPLDIKISSVRDSAGYHVIFDGVGGSYAEPALRALAWEGRYLSVGFAAGVAKVSLGPILFKNAVVMGIQPAEDSVRMPGLAPEAMARMFGWHTAGILKPDITAAFHLRDAVEGLRLLSERKATGRVVLVTDFIKE